MPRRPILISGAGIAGCTLAWWLLRRGFAPMLVERAPRFRTGGYVIDFWGAGFDVAERMDLIPALRAAGYVFNRLSFVSRTGRLRSSMGGDSLTHALGGRFLSIARGDLATAIYSSIERDAESMFGDFITGIEQAGDRVEATFEHGAPRAFDAVIGADGLHSAVRNIAFGAGAKNERFLGFYAASFLTEGYPVREEGTYLSYAAPRRQITRYSLRDDGTGILFVFRSPHEVPGLLEDPAARKEILRRTFSRDPWVEWPSIEERLEACGDLYFDAMSQIEMPRWSAGRAALVGDAAFCPSLLAGEGSALAMAGAYILAGEIERSEGDYASAFAAYERQFRPFIERRQKAARGFASSFAPETALGLFLRDQVLHLGAIPFVADYITRRMIADRFTLPDY